MNSKYSTFLTILLILIIIAILGIIGFLGIKFYQSYKTKNEGEDFAETWGDQIQNGGTNSDSIIPSTDDTNTEFGGVEDSNNGNSSTSGTNAPKYNGYVTSGIIEIPTTNVKGPILAEFEYSAKALETAVVIMHGEGLNKVGNTTIAGHNYRNGTLFSNNKKLNIGDKIYITDLEGKRLKYTIYDKFETTQNDSSYMVRNTNGAIEISLSTCTDDTKARLIILARADV